MILRVKIEDNKCYIAPNSIFSKDDILFYPFFRKQLFNELYSNGVLKESFVEWFSQKRKLNEDKTLNSDKYKFMITYEYNSSKIPVIFWYDGEKYKNDLL